MQFLSFSERPFKGTELMMLYKNAGWWEERNEQDMEEMLENEKFLLEQTGALVKDRWAA